MKNPETQAEIEEAIADYRNLLNSLGWKRVVAQLDANIEEIRSQLEAEGGENETKDDIDRLRDKLKLMREMRNMPEFMITKLESPESTPVNPDPYDNISDVVERKKEAELDKEGEE